MTPYHTIDRKGFQNLSQKTSQNSTEKVNTFFETIVLDPTKAPTKGPY